MNEKAKQLLLQQIANLEIGLGEACAHGAFKNLKYASDLNRSIEVLRAYFESAPVVNEKEILQSTNGKEK